MANKNTQKARKQGLSNRPVCYEGTGTTFQEKKRVAQDNTEFKGGMVNTAWNAPNSKRKSPHKYKGMDEKQLAKYRKEVAQFYGEA